MGDEWGRPSCANITLDDGRDLAVVKDTWDDEEDVADAWDAEEEPVVVETAKVPKKPKAKPAESYVSDVPANETEHEKKARLERLIREKDLEHAMSLFGISAPEKTADSAPTTSIAQSPFDTMTPTTVPEFDQFTRLITKRLETFEASKNYPQFLEGLIHTLMSRRDVPEIRKVAGVLTDMASQKLKEKQAATKAKPPPSLKATKGSGKYDAFDDYDDDDGFGE
ncbi:Eukaryotic translation initiation factor 3 subunit J [Paramicrosporidium saccamoebae]|uniref:Eukaryotic translation initiation factor 3 30 kDa subunit n=1 Tax=Paramicrosporidium saccamoebae TaxID=1246581 RepID=A0A2H9TL43_9FUNG|nr:Eukaryotic translation initiation factor 3 subunit J [Paramicrosporidium saccamoebae]